MTTVTAATTTEEVRHWCDRAGMRADSPLRLALLTTTEAAIAARDAAGGARGLTPDGERELIHRVAEATALGAEREMLRLSHRLDVCVAFGLTITALLLLATGYVFGRWQEDSHRGIIHSTSFLGQIAELNNINVLYQYCEDNTFQSNGRLACNLPPVWISAISN